MKAHPHHNAQYSLTMRVEYEHLPGMLGKVASAIGEAGGVIGAVDLVSAGDEMTIRDFNVETTDASDWPRLTAAVAAVSGARVIDTTDRTFLMHLGGKIEIHNKSALKTRDDLAMAYTPGVARVCLAIHDDREKAFRLHDQAQHGRSRLRRHGGARPGQHRSRGRNAGDGGQGHALQGVRRRRRLPDLRSNTKDTDEIIAVVRAIAPAFGGINLEDISAPRCFEIEERLQGRARHPGVPRRPARHRHRRPGRAAERAEADRQDGSRTCASWSCGMRRRRASPSRRSCWARASERDVVGVDTRGALHVGREDYLDGTMNATKRAFAEATNRATCARAASTR